MRRMQSFRYELHQDGEQERTLCKISGACRFVFNKALMIQKENYESGNTFTCYVAMAKQLTEWRNSAETPWLKEAPCHPLQHALKNLDRAYKKFFPKRADFPRFKRRRISSGFRYPDPLQIKLDEANSRIFLPKLGWSRTCPSCDHISEHNRKTQSQFECVKCGYKNHADVVGALNILERGQRLLACGEIVHLGYSKNREPAEAKSVSF